MARHEEYMKPFGGKILKANGAHTDLKTLLAYQGSAVNLTNPNDGRIQPEVALVRIDGADYDLAGMIETVMARLASTDGALMLLLSQLLNKTITHASGATGVTTADAIAGQAAVVTMGTVLTQTGAGTQTFAAPKAIVGKDEIDLTVTPGSEDPVVHTFKPTATMYGMTGIEDSAVSSGSVTRKTKHIVLTGAAGENWADTEGGAPYVLTLADKKNGTTNFACSHSKPAASGTTAGTCVGAADAKTITFYPPAGEDYDTLAEWKAALAAQAAGDPKAEPTPIDPTPVQLVYELDAPVTAADGGVAVTQATNNVATAFEHDGGGGISVAYKRDLNLAIASLEA